MKHILLIVALVACGALLGCENGLVDKTSLTGTYNELTAPAQPLGMYANVEVGSFSNAFSGETPPKLLADLPGRIVDFLKQAEVPTGQRGKTLVVEGQIIYYETAGSTGGSLSAFEEAVAEVRLLDQETGEVVATAHCIGRSSTFVSQGVDEKTSRLAQSIAAWVAEHYPKQPATSGS